MKNPEIPQGDGKSPCPDCISEDLLETINAEDGETYYRCKCGYTDVYKFWYEIKTISVDEHHRRLKRIRRKGVCPKCGR